MQRVEILRGTVVDGRTDTTHRAGDEAVLADSQVEYLGDQVATLEWVDENADADMDGTPDFADQSFDAETFVDQDYEVVVQAIERGAADDLLAEVWQADLEERDGRVHVQEALRERGYEPDEQQSEG